MIHHSFLIDNTMEKNGVFFYINDKSYLVFLHSFIISSIYLSKTHQQQQQQQLRLLFISNLNLFFLLCYSRMNQDYYIGIIISPDIVICIMFTLLFIHQFCCCWCFIFFYFYNLKNCASKLFRMIKYRFTI